MDGWLAGQMARLPAANCVTAANVGFPDRDRARMAAKQTRLAWKRAALTGLVASAVIPNTLEPPMDDDEAEAKATLRHDGRVLQSTS